MPESPSTLYLALLVLACGLATYLWRGLGVLFRRLRFRREVRALRRERDALVEDVIETVNAVKPKDLELKFPVDHPDRIEESSRERREADLDAEFDKDAAEDAAEEASER